ncbi:hypothetical protein K523DRAFT_395970 [Schizophyllum commune Tattone D]|nr:hypothetical protein K523DRAFT_395970 [Schizophyllum commune Tattone D]
MAFQSTLTYGRSLPAEICLMICEILDKRALASLTAVCKAWKHLANGPLWRTLPSLTPLLRLFPEDSRTRTRFLSDNVTIRRALTAQDWDLVLTRSCLVKAIDEDIVPEIRYLRVCYDATIVDALSACPLPSLILPSNAFAIATNKAEAVYLTLLSPHIRTFGSSGPRTNYLSGRAAEWDTLSLERIVRFCPKVSHLFVGARIPEGTLYLALETWTCLNAVRVKVSEHFDCEHILKALHQVPALRSVPSAYNESPPLEELALIGATSSWCCAIMHCFGIRHLKSLRLLCMAVEHLGPDYTDEELFEELQDVEFDNKETKLHFGFLSPFAPLSGLEHLTLAGGASDIDDANCDDCARWWPRLKAFHLKASRKFDECVGCTLNALLPFAEHCPDLQSLVLPINATKTPPLIYRPLRHHSLTYLNVRRGAKIKNHRQVALFLYEIFPNLEDLWPSEEGSDEDMYVKDPEDEIWYLVREAINIMRMKDVGVSYLV